MMLLDSGADPNGGSFDSGYPLYFAVGDLALFQALLAAGADPNPEMLGQGVLSHVRRRPDSDEYLAALEAAGGIVE